MEYDIRTTLGDYALPSIWCMRHRYLGGRRIRFYSERDPFAHRPFHVAPLDDFSKTIVVKKARQMGFTELFLMKMIHLATMLRCVSVYTLPKDRKAAEIASTRLTPLGAESHPDRFDSEIQSRMIAWRQVMFKQFAPLIGGGESSLIVTGSWNEDIGESTACDAVYLDEYDRMKPGVVSAFRMSLSSSKIDATRIFSTPSFPNMGVDEQIKTTDDKKWVWTCEHCGHRQPLTRANIKQVKGKDSLVPRLESHDKTAHFEPGTFQVACVKCQDEINRMTAHAEWVAERPDATASGYTVSQLDCAYKPADKIMEDLRDQEEPGLRHWYNYSLAEAYAGDAGRVAEGLAYAMVDTGFSMILDRSSFNARFPTHPQVVVGIDWGKSNWFMAMGRTPEYRVPIILDVKMFVDTNDPDDTVYAASQFCKKWGADAIIADQGYGHDRNPKLYQEFGEIFYACEYPGVGKRAATVVPLWGPNPTSGPNPIVNIGRGPLMKELIHALTQDPCGYRMTNNSSILKLLDVIDLHFRNMAISAEPDKSGNLVDVATSLGPDHFLHTAGYCSVGFKLLDTRDVPVIGLDPPGSVQSDEVVADLDVLPSAEDVVDLINILS